MMDKEEMKWYKFRHCFLYHVKSIPQNGLTLCGKSYTPIGVMPFCKFKGLNNAFSLLDSRSIPKFFKDRLCKKCCKKLNELRDA